MKKKLFLIIGMILLFGTQLYPGIPFETEETPFHDILAKAKTLKKPVMLDLYSASSVWCRRLTEKAYTDAEIIKFSQKFICVRKNSEQNEGIQLVKKYRPNGYPCILFFDGNGEEIDRIAGYLDPPQFLQRLVHVYMGVDTYAALKQQYAGKPHDVIIIYKLAEKLAAKGDETQARELYEKVLALDPGNKSGNIPKVHFYLGNNAVKANDFSEAEFHYTSILQKYQDFTAISYVYRSLAWIYTTLKQPHKAITVLEEGLTRLPAEAKNDALFYFLSLNYSLIGENQKSLELLTQITRGEVEPFLLQKARARNYFRLQKWDKGLAILGDEFERIKSDPRKVNDLTWLCVEEKVKSKLPISWAKTAVKKSNRDPLILDTLAELYALNGLFNEAVRTEKEALEKVTQEKYKQQFAEKIKKWKTTAARASK